MSTAASLQPQPAISPVAAVPMVSVILPVRNEATHIRACLASIFAQDYPADRIEILVVDGQSTDGTREIVARLGDPRVVLLSEPSRLIPLALNIGIRAATGEIIVRVDGHTTIVPDYVRRCVDLLSSSDAANVGGPMRPVGETTWGQAVALATTSAFGIGNGAFHDADRDDADVDTVYLGAYRRDVLDEIGGYDERFVCNEDDELNFRLRQAGHRIVLASSIKSIYVVRATPSRLWRQYWRYGQWKVAVIARHPGSLQWRHAIPPTFAAAVLAALSLRVVGGPGRHLWLGLALPWGIGATLATVRAARRAPSLRGTLLLPVVFAVLHLSYGLGFLWGIARWVRHAPDRGTAATGPTRVP